MPTARIAYMESTNRGVIQNQMYSFFHSTGVSKDCLSLNAIKDKVVHALVVRRIKGQ